jgi:hypothetical protein
MVRTQIQLTEEQARKLRRAARSRGVSMAEIVRRCLESGIESESADRAERYRRAAQVIGAFKDRDERQDVSVDHDRYLDRAFR